MLFYAIVGKHEAISIPKMYWNNTYNEDPEVLIQSLRQYLCGFDNPYYSY